MAYEDGNGDLGVIINAEMMILKGMFRRSIFRRKNRVVSKLNLFIFTIYDKTEKR